MHHDEEVLAELDRQIGLQEAMEALSRWREYEAALNALAEAFRKVGHLSVPSIQQFSENFRKAGEAMRRRFTGWE